MVATTPHLPSLAVLFGHASISHLSVAATLAAPAISAPTANTTVLVIVAAVVAALVILLRAARSVSMLFSQFIPFLREAWNAMTTIFCTMLISVVVIVALLAHH
ncbi:MAG TPA: hypothetical protein VFI65_09965 [Streptosporangiaceae bacterium]|nr:hypothetical protein [Streptosporangiaceae bacterium]